jgi:hypothetical protein
MSFSKNGPVRRTPKKKKKNHLAQNTQCDKMDSIRNFLKFNLMDDDVEVVEMIT